MTISRQLCTSTCGVQCTEATLCSQVSQCVCVCEKERECVCVFTRVFKTGKKLPDVYDLRARKATLNSNCRIHSSIQMSEVCAGRQKFLLCACSSVG